MSCACHQQSSSASAYEKKAIVLVASRHHADIQFCVQHPDVATAVPGTSNPAWFSEPFWGSDDKGIVAVFCQTRASRPVLMAVLPFNGPRPGDPADEIVAKLGALKLARRRSVDL